MGTFAPNPCLVLSGSSRIIQMIGIKLLNFSNVNTYFEIINKLHLYVSHMPKQLENNWKRVNQEYSNGIRIPDLFVQFPFHHHQSFSIFWVWISGSSGYTKFSSCTPTECSYFPCASFERFRGDAYPSETTRKQLPNPHSSPPKTCPLAALVLSIEVICSHQSQQWPGFHGCQSHPTL